VNDFAPKYSKRERLMLILKLLLLVILLLLVTQFWLLDWLKAYVKTANCQVYGNFDGIQLLLYGLFVGIPLSLALVLLLLEGRRSLRILKLGQNPLPGEKVLRRTRYKYGNAARVQPLVLFVIMLLLLGMSSWGSFQVEKMHRLIPPCSDGQLGQLVRQTNYFGAQNQ